FYTTQYRSIEMITLFNPFDWDGPALHARSTEWIVDLDAEITGSETQKFLSCNADHWQDSTNVGLPDSLKSVSIRLQELILRRTGIALLKCRSQCTRDDEARLLQLILGCEFGLNVTRTPESDDRPLFALEEKQDPTASGRFSGNGLRSNVIGFHTDGSGSTDRNVDLLTMLCLRPARLGGQSRVANAQMAYQSLPLAAKDALAKPFPSENPYAPEADLATLKLAPIFNKMERHGVSYFNFSYHPQFVRNGIGGDLGNFGAAADALNLLDAALERFSCDINLMTNEILFINNCVIAHD